MTPASEHDLEKKIDALEDEQRTLPEFSPEHLNRKQRRRREAIIRKMKKSKRV